MTLSSEQTTSKPVPQEELIETIIDSIQDIKGKRIVKIDLRGVEEAPTDFFIICEGESTTQVKGISDRIQVRVRDELGLTPGHSEGKTYARWILLDYFDVIVHVFYPEARFFYELEELWSDGITTEYENL